MMKQVSEPVSYYDFCLCMGRKIAWLRRKKGMSQKALAFCCDISPSYLAKIEGASGTLGTTLQILFIIASKLEIHLYDLLNHTDEDKRRVRLYKMKRKLTDIEQNDGDI